MALNNLDLASLWTKPYQMGDIFTKWALHLVNHLVKNDHLVMSFGKLDFDPFGKNAAIW
jgi:hypothetical protein